MFRIGEWVGMCQAKYTGSVLTTRAAAKPQILFALPEAPACVPCWALFFKIYLNVSV